MGEHIGNNRMKVIIKLRPVMLDPNYEWDARGSSSSTPENKDIADGLAYMISAPDLEVHSIYGKQGIWVAIRYILSNAV